MAVLVPVDGVLGEVDDQTERRDPDGDHDVDGEAVLTHPADHRPFAERSHGATLSTSRCARRPTASVMAVHRKAEPGRRAGYLRQSWTSDAGQSDAAGPGRVRLPAGARRRARRRGRARAAVPRRVRVDVRRLRRRVGVLHAVGLPDHVAGAGRARSLRAARASARSTARRVRRLLPASLVCLAGVMVAAWADQFTRRHPTAARPLGGAAAGLQLGGARRRRRLRRADVTGGRAAGAARPLLVAGDRGAVLLGVAARAARRPPAARRGRASSPWPSLTAAATASRRSLAIGGLGRRCGVLRDAGAAARDPRRCVVAVALHHRRGSSSASAAHRGLAVASAGLAAVVWAAVAWPSRRRPGVPRLASRPFAVASAALIVGLQVASPLRRLLSVAPLVLARPHQLRRVPVPLAGVHAGRRASPRHRPGTAVRDPGGDHAGDRGRLVRLSSSGRSARRRFAWQTDARCRRGVVLGRCCGRGVRARPRRQLHVRGTRDADACRDPATGRRRDARAAHGRGIRLGRSRRAVAAAPRDDRRRLDRLRDRRGHGAMVGRPPRHHAGHAVRGGRLRAERHGDAARRRLPGDLQRHPARHRRSRREPATRRGRGVGDVPGHGGPDVEPGRRRADADRRRVPPASARRLRGVHVAGPGRPARRG